MISKLVLVLTRHKIYFNLQHLCELRFFVNLVVILAGLSVTKIAVH